MTSEDAAGARRKLSLGRSPAMTLAAAVSANRTNLARFAVGDNPAIGRDKAKAQAVNAIPLREVFVGFLENAQQHVSEKYPAELDHCLLKDLEDLHRVFASILTPDVMDKAIGNVQGKTVPNCARAAFSSSLNVAAGKGIVPAAAYFAARMLPANVEASRERVLDFPELARIWRVADPDMGGGRMARFLILSGLRREEADGLHASEIDQEAMAPAIRKLAWTSRPAVTAALPSSANIPVPPMEPTSIAVTLRRPIESLAGCSLHQSPSWKVACCLSGPCKPSIVSTTRIRPPEWGGEFPGMVSNWAGVLLPGTMVRGHSAFSVRLL